MVVNQLKGLDKNKFEPYLLTLYPSKAANFLGEVNTFLPASQQRHFKLKNRSIFDLKTLWQVYRFLRQEKFDLVYTHLFLTNLIVRALAVLAGVKTIVSFEHSTYFDKSWWQIVVDRFLNLFTKMIITSTETVADFTKRQQHLAANKIIVLPNPIVIPLPDYNFLNKVKEEYKFNSEEKIFVMIGRFSEEKGHIVLLEAIHHATVKAKFLIVGHGPGEPMIKRRIAELKLEKQAILIREPEMAKQFLYLSDAFILPSLREGQGLVAYEALLANLPVIASDLPALKEIIKDEVNGLLFTTGSAEDLARAVNRLINEPDLLPKLKDGAKNTIVEYTVEEIGRRLSELFKELVSLKR